MTGTETMRPYDAASTEDLIRMESDNHPQGGKMFSILHNGESVSIHAPKGKGWIAIPRDQFNELVDWYMAPQELRGRPAP